MDLRTEIIDRLLKQVEDYHFSIRTLIMAKGADMGDAKLQAKLKYFNQRIVEVHAEIDKKLYPREFSEIDEEVEVNVGACEKGEGITNG